VIVTPLSDRGPAAIRDALLSHGWEGDLSLLTSSGLELSAFDVRGVDAEAIEAMVSVAARLGLELVTGPDWLILAGPRSRLGAFARPWVQPAPVQSLATAIGMAMPSGPAIRWRHTGGEIGLDRPVMVGVINVTPDSFSDAGRYLTVTDALAHAVALLEGGATVLDVGGESTRPGAQPVGEAEEQARILPVIRALHAEHRDVPVSVDTVHAATARAALDAGATIVNDVTAGRHDPAILAVAAERGAGVVLSHSRGALGALASYELSDYQGDVTGAVVRELAEATSRAVDAGIASEAIVVDPGFGFAKRPEQNFTLLDQLDALVGLGHAVLVGVSRKRFLATPAGRDVSDRDRATAAACAIALDRGARLFRVHDPAAVRDALAVSAAVSEQRA
jgi:dihydropteroate synthase